MKTANNRYTETGGCRIGFGKIVLSSAHGIIICVILLASFSWAWFSEKVEGPSIRVKAATYGITAKVSHSGNVVTSGDYSGAMDEGNSAIEVENGKVYEISLSVPEETALRTECGGYCIVSAGDDLHYTVPIGGEKDGVKNPEEIIFQIWFPGTGTSRIEFHPYWGEYPKTIPEEDSIPKIRDILENGLKYVVSDEGIMVSGGDNSQSE